MGRGEKEGEVCESTTTVLSMCIHCTEMIKRVSEEERNERSRGREDKGREGEQEGEGLHANT